MSKSLDSRLDDLKEELDSSLSGYVYTLEEILGRGIHLFGSLMDASELRSFGRWLYASGYSMTFGYIGDDGSFSESVRSPSAKEAIAISRMESRLTVINDWFDAALIKITNRESEVRHDNKQYIRDLKNRNRSWLHYHFDPQRLRRAVRS